MSKKKSPLRKISSLVLGLAVGVSCSTDIVRLSPYEKEALSAQSSVQVEVLDGKTIEVNKPVLTGDELQGIGEKGEPLRIPRDSIRSVFFKKQNSTIGILYGGLLIVEAALAIGASTAPSPPPAKCCPLVFSGEGDRWILEAEPYGGAIARGLKRTEWIPLEHLKASDGVYRLRVANELDEVEHTDELKIVAFDHEKGVRILPDASGRFWPVRRLQPPRRAADGDGRDVAPLLASRDGRFWECGGALPLNESAPLRDRLVLEFDKPAGAKTALLVADAWTTFPGSRSAEALLDNLGGEAEAFKAEIDGHGPAYGKILNWFAREEMFLLKVWVETPRGWRQKSVLYGGGPCVAKEKAYLLDISDVEGETLRIRLDPPAGFWRFDAIGVDFSGGGPVSGREIQASTARDGGGRDVRDLLARTDDAFVDLPRVGDAVELIFPAPPLPPGQERSLILKASGYYDINLTARGEARREEVEKILSQPGYAVRLARKTFAGPKAAESHAR